MTHTTIRTINGDIFVAIGTTLKVRYGSKNGVQIARVTKITEAGNVYARKFSKARQRWSKTDLRIYPQDIIGMGTL